MVGCRKIYCNFLLLSVMLFLLGGAVRPVVPGWHECGVPCAWRASSEPNDFRWEDAGTLLVYRSDSAGNILTGTATELLAPERPAELLAPSDFTVFYSFAETLSGAYLTGEQTPRAPPCGE